MNYLQSTGLSLILLGIAISAQAVPMTFSLTGDLEDRNFAQLFEFDVSATLRPREVSIQTFASDGGTNAAGQIFNPPRTDAGPSMVDHLSEGFEPYLFLFNPAGTLIRDMVSGFPGNESTQPFDVLFRELLFPGTYTLALLNRETPNSDRLEDGFSGETEPLGRQFVRGPFIDNGPLWAIDFTGVEDVRALPGSSRNITSVSLPLVATVPEPQGFILFLLSGLVLLGCKIRSRQISV